ncbi:MAG: hypothetical protein AAGC57_21150 [Pseudomonadota bacterium]
MTDLETRLAELFEPARGAAVEALLKAMAGAIGSDAEVDAEPVRQSPDGQIERFGPLSLPERGDLSVSRAGRRLVRRIEEPGLPEFEPVSVVFDGGFTCVVSPFRWSNCEVIIDAMQPKPDWGPLRRWFIEWFQPRVSDVAPDLAGVVHRLEGPEPVGPAWRAALDLGSAPVRAATDLIPAVMQSGALRMRFATLE